MRVTIDTTNKTFEVCTEGELIDFSNLIIELQKTLERCKNTMTIPNNTSTTGIPYCKSNTVNYDKTLEFLKSHSSMDKTASVRSNF